MANTKNGPGGKPHWAVGVTLIIEEKALGAVPLRGRDRRRRRLHAVPTGGGNRDTHNDRHAEHNKKSVIDARKLGLFHASRSSGGKRLGVARQCGRAGQSHSKYQRYQAHFYAPKDSHTHLYR